MIVEIVNVFEDWKVGDIVDVTRSFGQQLIDSGIAREHEDQTRRDYTPKPKEEAEPQKIEVNNYFIVPEEEEINPPRPRKKP